MRILFSLALCIFIGSSLYGQTISSLYFSFGVGYFGDVGGATSGSMSNTGSVTFSSRGVTNGYFTSVTPIAGSSNNYSCNLVCELSNGTQVSVPGRIFARQASGSLQALFWKPNNGTSQTIGVAPNTFTVSTPTTEANNTTAYGVVVQCIGQTITVGQNSIQGNSGVLTFADLQDYASSYPTVNSDPETNVTVSGSTLNGRKLVASTSSTNTQTSVTISSAGFYYSNLSTVNCIGSPSFPTVGTLVTATYSVTTAHTQEVSFASTIAGLSGESTYYYRAYIELSNGTRYQGEIESFTTCADAPVGTGATICSGSTASISATGAGTLSWYSQANGGSVLGTGSSYTTAALTNSTSSNSTVTYYVEASGSSCASTRTAVTVTVKPVTTITPVCDQVYTFAKSSSSTIDLSTQVQQSGSGTYVWNTTTSNSNQGGIAVSGYNNVTTNSFVVPTSTSGFFYYYFTLNDGCGVKSSPVYEVVIYDNLWDGSSSTDWSTAANWSTGAAPTSNDVVVIPSSSVTNFPNITNITINSGGAVVILNDARLTMSGTMTNNGTFVVQHGGTFVYTHSAPFDANDTGSYIFKQNITGKSALFGSTYQPVGRYWYMGIPFTQQRSVFGTTPSATESNGPLSSKVWGWNEAGGSVWSEISTQSQNLNPAQGYLVRVGATCKNLEFSTTTTPYVDAISQTLYRSNGSNSLDGFNLLANPFPAYIDAVSMNTTSSNLGNTMWYRTFHTGSNQMVFDHFQANSPSASIVNSNAGHSTSQLQKIPPYQAFWVRVQGSVGSTGTAVINRNMLTHESNGMELKSTHDFKAFVRMNLVQDTKSDQVVVYMENEFTPGFDKYDGEKMFVAGMPQVYTKTGSYKLAIQSIKADKSKTTIPVSVEIPTPTMYTFDFIDHHVQSGKVFLEDKKYGIYVDLDIDTAYTFFSTSGTLHDRFALHFMRKVIGAADPTIVDDWANAELGQDEDLAIKSLANEAVLVSRPVEHEGTAVVTVFDLSGKQVYSSQMESTTQQFELHGLHGIFLIQVVSNGQLFSQKVLLN